MDPVGCAECHPAHYREWSGSMHAYASTDPVFLAMNARAQRETGGELGDFCVRCHAPLAVHTGATTDGLNLAELPARLQGVGCYFCHAVAAVEGTHNNPLVLARDGVMRGGLDDPLPNPVHRSSYSPLLDRNRLESASLCGSCHDIETPSGVHLERTFAEWQGSVFARADNPGRLSCSSCHMQGRDEVAATVDGATVRRVHDHSMPGVDVALTPFPEAERQREAVQRALDTTLLSQVCLSFGSNRLLVSLENVAAGHRWPSGAAQDRRAWVEVIGYAGDEVVFESGVVEEGSPVTSLEDPQLWQLRDHIYGENGQLVHMFWEAASYESSLLPPSTTLSPADPGYEDPHVQREYLLPRPVDRVTVRVRIRPIGLDVIDDLIASGDLDPELRGTIPTFTLRASEVEWRLDQLEECVP